MMKIRSRIQRENLKAAFLHGPTSQHNFKTDATWNDAVNSSSCYAVSCGLLHCDSMCSCSSVKMLCYAMIRFKIEDGGDTQVQNAGYHLQDSITTQKATINIFITTRNSSFLCYAVLKESAWSHYPIRLSS
jgi:hypothetical protein